MNSSDSAGKTARYLFRLYCLFILYGCFIPFHFNFDPNFLRWRWAVFLAESLHESAPQVSLPDMVSNILLFVPFGILSVWARLRDRTYRNRLWPILQTTLYGLSFAIVIESGQTLAPGRDPSMLDALCNGVGAFFGAAWGLLLVRSYQRYLQNAVTHGLFIEPSLLFLAYILFGVLVDSYFPFDVTLDVSSVWHNIQRSQFLFSSASHRYWLDLSVTKGIVYAAVGYLILISLRQLRPATSMALVWLLTTALACAIELGKIFFAGRAFHSNNVIMAAFGGIVGALLVPRLCACSSVKRHREAIWFMLTLAFLFYFELWPFDWIHSNELPGRLLFAEWLPFKSYYYAEPVRALFDLQKKVYVLIPLGFATAMLPAVRGAGRPRQKAALLCLAVTLSLELAQFFVQSRIPSVTDLIIFNFGAWIGLRLCALAVPIKQPAGSA